MDSKYILTPNGDFASIDELYHWGIKGMRWGVRRYQNPDGSLTSAGRKRYTNPDGSLNEKGKKKFGDSEKISESSKSGSKQSSGESSNNSKRQDLSDMSDNELQSRVNRLRNEDAYRDLSKKLGYDGPKSELDAKIADMEKQKRYLELQRDIKNLTPKKVSKGQQIVDALMKKVIEPSATEAGKKLLAQYLTEAGAQVLGKTAKKEVNNIEKTVKKSAEKVKQKEAKKQAKEEAVAEKKEAKKQAKEEAKAEKQQAKEATETEREKQIKFTVEGEGTSGKKSSSNSKSSKSNTVVDMEPWPALNAPITSLATTKNTSSGSSFVSRYKNTPVSSLPSPNISGYPPAPKDDDN